MNELSLFSGYGGFSLGLRLTGMDIRTVAYVEIEPYCQEILKARIRDGFLDDAPIWPDISTFNGAQCRGVVDIITAGFPCQPHSTAGKRKGKDDARNLWPDTLRVIREVGPSYVLLENVPGILSNGYGGTVVGELSDIGYDCRWGIVSAAAVGAPHLRKRWWCLAHIQRAQFPFQQGGFGQQGSEGVESRGEGKVDADRNGKDGAVAYPQEQPQREPDNQACPITREDARESAGGGGWWAVEPGLGRVAHGVTHRVDRLKAIGNGIVPAVVAEFLRLS